MKKTLCILLALLFSLGTVFAGCSEKQGETTDAAAPTGSAEAAVSPGEEAEDETEFVDPFAGTDLGGRDFRVYTSVDTSDATNGDAFIRGSGEINGEADLRQILHTALRIVLAGRFSRKEGRVVH